MRFGIFGGTFDPPHIAHLILAAEALDQLELSRILWVLTLNPPHKENQAVTNLQHRMDMVQAAIDQEPAFEFSSVDIDRPPPHYAVDTVRILREKHPYDTLVYLMGGDSLDNLKYWHKPIEFVRRCDEIGVMRRSNSSLNDVKSKELYLEVKPKLRLIDTPLIDISASMIRQRIHENRPYRYFVPPEVFQIIQERSLYQDLIQDD